eukprot:COSAG01_NODE_29150_length_644_cov_0.944954_1_plen_145_part_01
MLQVHEELVALEQRFAQRIPAVRLPLVPDPRCAHARPRTLGPRVAAGRAAKFSAEPKSVATMRDGFGARRTGGALLQQQDLLPDPGEQLRLVLLLLRLRPRHTARSAGNGVSSQKEPGVEPYLEFIVHLALLGLVDAVDVGHAQL